MFGVEGGEHGGGDAVFGQVGVQVRRCAQGGEILFAQVSVSGEEGERVEDVGVFGAES